MTELHYPQHLPAVLIGVSELRVELARELPWAHSVHHQHGGYACLQSELFGIVLPVSVAPGCAELLRGFDPLGVDAPSRTAFKTVPELERVHLTMGQEYGAAELECAFLRAPQVPTSFETAPPETLRARSETS